MTLELTGEILTDVCNLLRDLLNFSILLDQQDLELTDLLLVTSGYQGHLPDFCLAICNLYIEVLDCLSILGNN